MIRLVATDLDGTLLNSEGRVSARNRAALDAALEAGLLVAFVTGRPPRWLDDLLDETGHQGVAVGANGAVLYDLATETVLVEHTLEPDVMHDIAHALRREFDGVTFASERGHGFAAEPGYTHDWQVNPLVDRRGVPIPPPRIGTLAEVVADPAIKLLAKDHSVDADTFLAAATEVVGDRATLTHSSSFGLLEMSAPGVTKATGLADLAERNGIAPHEVATIGDMPNDIPMLQWSGHSFAVANAHPAVKEAAREVTVSNDDHAVAVLIESVLAERA